jgi:Dolichyl-phosphate-mannose-protein mannosyltransferase
MVAPVSGYEDADTPSLGGAATPPRAWTAIRTASAARVAGALVLAILGMTLALHFVWLWRFRHGYLTEWDESGYMQFALGNFDALHDHGIVAFAKSVGGRGTFGPLLPFVTALGYPVLGRGIFGSLLVMPFFFAALVLAAYGVARRVVSDAWAVVAALSVSAIPAVTDYTRLFHFAVPATACMTATIWALLRSDGLRRTRWAIAAGALLALTMLARTMAVGYLPGLAAAAVALLVMGKDERRLRYRNLALAGATAALLAGPWYVRNARSVYDSLVHTGYGAQATPFGHHYSFASWAYWTKELRLDLSYLSLPVAGVLFLCFCAALADMVMRRRRREPTAARVATRCPGALLALGLVVVEGYLVLTSSRNEGTAFALPWLPALAILAVAAMARVRPRILRLFLGSALVAVSLVAVLSKSGWVAPLATVRTASVPGLGSVGVTDGRGLIQTEVAGAGYDIGPPTDPLPSMHRRWLPLERQVVGWSIGYADARGQPLHLSLGFQDLLFANSRLILAAQLWFHRFLPVKYVRSWPEGDTVASYRRQLVSPRVENALITGKERRGATITVDKVEAAARSLGFVPVKSFEMPDGRRIWIWWRTSAGA